jgi:DNA-binding NarL/FixJ family response regulator
MGLPRPPLVERHVELEKLRAALDRATMGEPSLTIVAGEAGIGKTRLVLALDEVAEEFGVAVLRGDCLRIDDGELPFAPLAAALRDVPAEVLDRLPRAVRFELGTAFPHLAREDGPRAPESDRYAQRRLFDALVCLLGALAETNPVVLVLEDFHWADRSTRDFTVYLARGARDERLATVLTYRTHDDVPAATHAALRDLERLGHSERIDLAGLSRAGVEQLAGRMLGGPASAAVVDRVHERSGGNPFYAEEFLVAYLNGPGARLPASVVSTLEQRLRRVSPPAQQLLRCVAAIGRPVTWPFLAATCGMAEIDLSRALREALDQHLLIEQGAEPVVYAYRHVLMRDVVYEGLHDGERRTLHATIGEHLAGTRTGTHAELAFHWRAAGRNREALVCSLLAGLEAERSRSYVAAADDFRAAAQLWDALDGAPADAPLDRLEVAGHLSDALKHAGDYGAAADVCEAALRACDADEEPARAAAFHERLGALSSSHSEIALERFGAALRLLPAHDRAKRARLMAEEACALVGLERPGEARQRAQDALSLAAEAGANAEALYARTVLGLALVSAGRPDEGEECFRLALQTPADQAEPDDLLRGYLYLGEASRLRGRFDDACATMERGARLAAELGMQGAFGWYMEVNAAADLFHLGRWDEADARLERARDQPLESWAEMVLRQVSGQLALARGNVDDAEAELRLGLRRCDDAQPECSPPIYATLAELALWRGDPGAAQVLVDEGLAVMETARELLYTPALHWVGARAHADAAAHAMDTRRPDVAHRAHAAATTLTEDLAARIAENRGRHLPPTAAACLASCEAEVLRAAAQLSRIQAGNRGQAWERTAAAWQHAIALWTDVGCPQPAIYGRLRAVEAMLAASGRTQAAAAALRAARADADRLGAALLRDEIDGLARRVRIDPSPEAERTPRPELPLGLTRRELQTLELLSQGLTNREIADKLVISVRTVDVHVSRIIGKLGAGNRTEAVAAAHRLGLTV